MAKCPSSQQRSKSPTFSLNFPSIFSLSILGVDFEERKKERSEGESFKVCDYLSPSNQFLSPPPCFNFAINWQQHPPTQRAWRREGGGGCSDLVDPSLGWYFFFGEGADYPKTPLFPSLSPSLPLFISLFHIFFLILSPCLVLLTRVEHSPPTGRFFYCNAYPGWGRGWVEAAPLNSPLVSSLIPSFSLPSL